MDMPCMVHAIVRKDAHVRKTGHACVPVKRDSACADQTAPAVPMERVSVRKDAHVTKAEHAFVLAKPDHACADQIVTVASQ